MPTTFREYARDQDLLLPPSLEDWLPSEHLAYFISELIDELDLSAFYAPYEGDGRRKMPYEPSMMLKVLVYAYATGVFSSRKIATELEEDVAFRVLAAGNVPTHRALCAFRKRHLADFKAVFGQVVQLAGAVGLVQLGTVAVAGTKVRANASKHKAMSHDRLTQQSQHLQEAIDELGGQAQAIDAEEDARLEADIRGDEMPEELAHRTQRLAKIRQAKADLETARRDADTARGRRPDDQRRPPSGRGPSYKRDFGVPDDRAQSNFTDGDSRIMATSEGNQQCYNGQLAVDDTCQMIVANDLRANARNQGALQGLTHPIEDTLGKRPERLLADAGYRKEQAFQTLEAQGIDAYVALGREGQHTTPSDANEHPATCRTADKLATPDGREQYRQRKHLVEAANGGTKHILGFRRFSIRGNQGASGEWDLVCLATNLRRMRPLSALQ